MPERLRIAFFGSSLLSSWWNGACTYYRGLIRGLDQLGHVVTFYEPLAFGRQDHRDIDQADYARVVTYPAVDADAVRALVHRATSEADVVIKTSGVGVMDDVLEHAVADLTGSGPIVAFWDVDAPATLARMEADPDDALRSLIGRFDAILTYGGGEPVRRRYLRLGARECHVVYNALDPSTHHRVAAEPRFAADCALLANRLPDREHRVDEFFFGAAERLPARRFLLAGNGWDDKPMPSNVRWIGHLGTADHNAFNSTPLCVLNVTRDSMAANGWSPPTRVFEAAGAGACIITDAWDGVDDFFIPHWEILVARDGAAVADHISEVTPLYTSLMGERALARVLEDHTYARRAQTVDGILRRIRTGLAA
jgi:spore maturation protein CgeB